MINNGDASLGKFKLSIFLGSFLFNSLKILLILREGILGVLYLLLFLIGSFIEIFFISTSTLLLISFLSFDGIVLFASSIKFLFPSTPKYS